MQRHIFSPENKTEEAVMFIVNNISTDTEYKFGQQLHPPLSRTVCILLAAVCIIAFVVGTIGNASVLALFIKYKSLRTSSNIFVINLTIVDLLLCVVCLPMLINSFIREEVDYEIHKLFCNINTFLGAFTGFLSIWSLVCLAFDRCIVITRSLPIRYSSDKVVATYAIIAVWICCLVAAGIPFCGYGRYALEGISTSCEKVDNFTRSFSNIFYNIMIQVFFLVVPIVCITSCYCVIYIKVRNHEKNYFSVRKSGQYDEVSFRRMRRSRKLERTEMKTVRVGIILISVFCLSWTPFSVVSLVSLFGNREMLTPIMVALPAVFAKLLTILNPLLYALLLRSFKDKLTLFCTQYCRQASSLHGSVDRSIPVTGSRTPNLPRSKKCIVFTPIDHIVITSV